MPEAWELAPDTGRTADATTTFILFCEDTVNEPSYFRSFQKPGKVKINVVEGQMSSFKNVINTLSYCESEGLLETAHNHYKIKVGITSHIWSVFDRDLEDEDISKIDPADDLLFSFSIQSAEQSGLKVAWSNDVFELWILLHFEDVNPGDWCHRTYVYERLTAIFMALPNQPAEMLAITGKESFNYKVFLKRKAFFNLYVLPLLASRRDIAIKRAIKLEGAFPASHKSHQCNPCTRVHELVQSILSFA